MARFGEREVGEMAEEKLSRSGTRVRLKTARSPRSRARASYMAQVCSEPVRFANPLQ